MNIQSIASIAFAIVTASSAAMAAAPAEQKCGAGSCSKKVKSSNTVNVNAPNKEAACSKKDGGCSKKDASCSKKDGGCSKKEAGCSKKDGGCSKK